MSTADLECGRILDRNHGPGANNPDGSASGLLFDREPESLVGYEPARQGVDI